MKNNLVGQVLIATPVHQGAREVSTAGEIGQTDRSTALSRVIRPILRRMAYSASVYNPVHRPEDGALLLDAPLGSGSAVSDYWVRPGRRLGMRLMGQLGGDELTIDHEDLTEFAAELAALRLDWIERIPDGVQMHYQIAGRGCDVPLLADLFHRADLLEAAITMAGLIEGGYLHIC